MSYCSLWQSHAIVLVYFALKKAVIVVYLCPHICAMVYIRARHIQIPDQQQFFIRWHINGHMLGHCTWQAFRFPWHEFRFPAISRCGSLSRVLSVHNGWYSKQYTISQCIHPWFVKNTDHMLITFSQRNENKGYAQDCIDSPKSFVKQWKGTHSPLVFSMLFATLSISTATLAVTL